MSARRVMAFCVGLGSATGAFAINGAVYIRDCSTCNTSSQFVATAVSQAMAQAQAGTYVVSSASVPRTALVRVSGTRMWTCDNYGENCEVHLHGASGTAVDFNGSAIGSDSDLNRIDEATFAAARNQPLLVNLSPTYQGSFINSYDEEVGPGISFALGLKGINVATLAEGTLVLVVFPDGTKAVFIKTSNMTDMWHWVPGQAWDANGKKINRNGTLATNPNSSGTGGGAATVSRTPPGSDVRFDVGFQSKCAYTTTIRIDGVLVGSITTHAPC